MRITAWRITKRRHARIAFSGEGARLFGGRWNNPGTAVIYCADSRSLAALEILVHLDSADLLQEYALFEVGFDRRLVMSVETAELPPTWRSARSLAKLRSLGDSWAAQQTSAILQVPSALVPGECNFLLNPRHPDFKEISIGKPVAYRFDPRLKGP